MSRRRAAVLGAVLLAVCAAPWIAPLDPHAVDDPVGARLLPPGTRAHVMTVGPRSQVLTRGKPGSRGDWIGHHGSSVVRLEDHPAALGAQARLYLLGTDALGRDLLGRLLHGLRHSVIVASLAVLLASLIGVVVGAAAGLGRGWLDGLLMRTVDVFLSVPRVLAFLLLAALFRPSLVLLVAALAVTSWSSLARLVRVGLLAGRDGPLAESARASGCTPTRVTAVHLLPQVWPVLAVSAALMFADVIVLEAALAFLGLGAPPPAISLGAIIAGGRDVFPAAWWVVVGPAVVLVGAVLFVRSTLVSAFAPKLRRPSGVGAGADGLAEQPPR